MIDWSDIKDAFDKLNEDCSYLVLRNFEGFFDDILIEGHNDIDVLCKNRREQQKMVKILGAVPRIGVDNGIHYKFLLRGNEIALDIRTVGDGYYDANWQKNMLNKRIYNPIGFYTMNDEDYFYSFIYHAIYQKETLSEEYLLKLRNMGNGTSNFNQFDFEKVLLDFMSRKGYYYTMTYDKYVVLYFNRELVADYIKYPISIRKRHLQEKMIGYILGKVNGARIKLLRLFNQNE